MEIELGLLNCFFFVLINNQLVFSQQLFIEMSTCAKLCLALLQEEPTHMEQQVVEEAWIAEEERIATEAKAAEEVRLAEEVRDCGRGTG